MDGLFNDQGGRHWQARGPSWRAEVSGIASLKCLNTGVVNRLVSPRPRNACTIGWRYANGFKTELGTFDQGPDLGGQDALR